MEQVDEKQLRVNKIKSELKDKVVLPSSIRHLSAQYFNNMDSDEREALRQIVEESGQGYDEYEKRMKKLFPAEAHRKAVWRKNG